MNLLNTFLKPPSLPSCLSVIHVFRCRHPSPRSLPSPMDAVMDAVQDLATFGSSCGSARTPRWGAWLALTASATATTRTSSNSSTVTGPLGEERRAGSWEAGWDLGGARFATARGRVGGKEGRENGRRKFGKASVWHECGTRVQALTRASRAGTEQPLVHSPCRGTRTSHPERGQLRLAHKGPQEGSVTDARAERRRPRAASRLT